MKARSWTTHDIASVAEFVSIALRRLPNVPLVSLPDSRSILRNALPSRSRTRPDVGAIDTLSRSELTALVTKESMPIAVRAKDSTAKIRKRLLRHLRLHPEVAERLLRVKGKGSPELSRALNTLLNYGLHGDSR